jgi:DNA polymerase-4
MLDPLPVGVIPGIGRETLARLRPFGIETIADLRLAPDHQLESVFGRYTQRTRARASGVDDRPVVPVRADKSISAEETFDTDLDQRADMHRQLLKLSEKTASRLRAKELVAGTVQVKIRQADFTTFTRQSTLRPPTNGTEVLYRAATRLLDEWLLDYPDARLRLLGVGGSALVRDAQPDLFAQAAAPGRKELDHAVDEIRSRFGSTSVSRARALNSD